MEYVLVPCVQAGRGGGCQAEPCPPRREALAGGIHQRCQERSVHRAPAAVRPQRCRSALSPTAPCGSPRPPTAPRHPLTLQMATATVTCPASRSPPLCPHSPARGGSWSLDEAGMTGSLVPIARGSCTGLTGGRMRQQLPQGGRSPLHQGLGAGGQPSPVGKAGDKATAASPVGMGTWPRGQ